MMRLVFVILGLAIRVAHFLRELDFGAIQQAARTQGRTAAGIGASFCACRRSDLGERVRGLESISFLSS